MVIKSLANAHRPSAHITFTDPTARTPEEAVANLKRLLPNTAMIARPYEWDRERLDATRFGGDIAAYVDGVITVDVLVVVKWS